MIRVIIADDLEIMQRVMKALLEAADDIHVVAQANSFDAVAEACRENGCDVVVLDDYLPPYSCAVAIKQLRAANVTATFLVTSMHADADIARRALDAGAAGFLLKTDLQKHFIPSVHALHAGETYLSPQIAQLLNA